MERYQGLVGPALVIQHTGQVFPLTQAPVTIGRQADNAMILSDPQVSRRHATLYWQAGDYFVQDLNSANGTYINERRIAGTQPLHHGDTLRLGNTVLEVHLAPPGPATEQVPLAPSPADNRPSSLLPVLIGLLVAGILIACLAIAALLLLDQLRARPSVAIQSPLPGAQVLVDSEVTLAAVAAGVRNITLLELRVDDTVVASTASPDPRGTASLTISKPWRFTQPGAHVVSAVAYSARGSASAPATVDLLVVAETATPSPTVTPTETESIPTPLPPTPTQPEPTIPLPTETATSTPAPTDTPRPTTTPTATSTKVPAPRIEYFRATPSTIAVGACATLEWGSVTNASAAVIDHGIGGIGTPGATPVCPTETTTYIMTATGPGGITTASATVTVGAGLPDLSVVSIAFDPSPPVRGQPTQVRITARNAGGTPAGAFGWEWLAGAEGRVDGRLGGLNAGESTTFAFAWTPANAYDDLATIARVDIDNEVAEADESNNALQVNTTVVESALGDLELQDLFLSVDSQIVLRVSNSGAGIAAPTFDYHLYLDGTLVASGSRPTPPMGSRAISTGYALSGEHRIRAVIDPDNRIAESNEGNNELTLDCSSASLVCSPPP